MIVAFLVILLGEEEIPNVFIQLGETQSQLENPSYKPGLQLNSASSTCTSLASYDPCLKLAVDCMRQN